MFYGLFAFERCGALVRLHTHLVPFPADVISGSCKAVTLILSAQSLL